MKFSVAMASYNGARHIADQLESLARQSHLPSELVVGDDGSSDATLDIIEDFAKHAPFPVYVHRNETNLGYARNFFATAMRCRGDWIAFCDQDDVWLPNKLEDAARAIEQTPGCTMVLQNAWLCDGDLTSRGRKFPNRFRPGIKGRRSQYGFWVWPGFVKTISRKMIELVTDGKDLPKSWHPQDGQLTHDKWSCVIANAIGGICVLDEPAALYRRHEAALTGNYNRQSLTERIKKSFSVSGEHYNFLQDVAQECAAYMDQLAQNESDPAWCKAFRESAAGFKRIGRIQGQRAALYGETGIANRIAAFLSIWKEGGYLGAPFHAMGVRSAAKDAMRVVVGQS